ncbi:glycosyltransferase family protein [Conexibacter woesei]|uniref:Glycosyl transferase group 1 n=1 Tax=Conexibacter woesei (strain DSM 14684 / CCUG 47730 / CIP 108061 / JCM 11494 / NBRC 100937 / ID131577) TaxID=469383 RepID=D3FFF9_CONWI|nr:hypothetical protein [Conexibacter woesei]ADB53752.1 hypothetical protein Cwoe_5347 [Conexibacter woesei DSM 14684]
MRIGVLRDEGIVNSLYRAVIPMETLAARGHDVRWDGKTTRAFNVRMLESCDVVYVHRFWDPDGQKLVRHLRSQGVAVWWDNDDDISAVPRESVMYKKSGGVRGAAIVAGMKRMMGLADLVTTPSEVLAERYRAYDLAPVRVIENYLPDHFPNAAARRSAGDTVTIGWTAGLEHGLDLEKLGLRPVLQRLLDVDERVRVVGTGLQLDLRGDRYRHIRGVQLSELAAHNATYDIGIAPLADIAMNRARSDIKVKEYAAGGVPWLASPVGPYRDLGEKQGGRLVPDDRWAEELTRLVDDARARRKLAKRAGKWGKSSTISENVSVWEDGLRTAVSLAGRR